MPLSNQPFERPTSGVARSLASVALLAALTTASNASATIWFVAPCGSDAWVGVSGVCSAPLGPKRTIAAALAVASDGDEIRLLPGTYVGSFDLDGKAVHLHGLAGPAATIVDGNGSGPVVLCNSAEGSDTIIEGITITGGDTATTGGGMRIALASPTIIDCVFDDNHAGTLGGGVSVATGSPHFVDCLFSSNSADQGGGAVSTSYGLPEFDGCTFESNDALYGGAILTSYGSAAIRDCTISFNDADLGAGLYISHGSPEIEDSLFEWNDALQSGGAIHAVEAEVTIESTDFFDNGATANGGGLYAADGSISLSDVWFEGNEAEFGGGVSAIGGASLSIVASTFRLNHATGSSGAVSTADTSINLLGCVFEQNSAVTVGGLGALRGDVSAFGCTFTGNSASFACGALMLGSIEAGDAVFQLCSFTDNTGAIGGGALTLLDGGATFEATQFLGNSAASGGAISDLSESDATDLVLRDCTFHDNHANLDGGAVRLGDLVSLDAARCTFSDNGVAFGSGGAVWTYQTSALLSSCEIRNNSAGDDGGGLWAAGTLSMVNCLVAGNTSADRGGGAFVSASAPCHVANCTITANTATNEGDGLYVGGSAETAIVNSIVWANGSPQIAGGMHSLSHSIAPIGFGGPGCIASNPKFVSPAGGDYRLIPSSPAIDAGLLWLLPSDAADIDEDGNVVEQVGLDLDGDPRVRTASAGAQSCGQAIDMGAYEAALGVSLPPTFLGDLNHDGAVGPIDLAIFLAEWGAAGGCPLADLDGDSVVGASDLAILLASWTT